MVEFLSYKNFCSIYPRRPVLVPNSNSNSLMLSVCRSRRCLRRLIYSNYGQYTQKTKYLVLTKRENWGLDEANNYFKKFILRLDYKLGFPLRYVNVPEFQKRGSVHYNLLMFNFPFMNDVYSSLRKVWGGDMLKMNVIEGSRDIRRVVPYISKYISKQMNDRRFYGRKRYFRSGGLFKPVEITDDVMVQMSLYPLERFKIKESRFDTQFHGEMIYKRFDISSVGNFLSIPALSYEVKDYLRGLSFPQLST